MKRTNIDRRCREPVKYLLTKQRNELNAIHQVHDDLHGRNVSKVTEQKGKTRSWTRRRFVSASIDSIIVRVLSQPDYARVSRYQIYFFDEESSFGVVPTGTSIRDARSSSSMHIFNATISFLSLLLPSTTSPL